MNGEKNIQSNSKQFSMFDSIFKQSNEYWKRVSEKMSDTEYEAWILQYVSNEANDENKNKLVDEQLYCLCRQAESGSMIACDNTLCRTEWFHFQCVGISQPPEGAWFCRDCGITEELPEGTAQYKEKFNHPQNMHNCVECEQTFVKKGYLTEHRRTHQSLQINDGLLPCPECQQTFKGLGSLRKHIETNVHNDRRPFKCTICSKSFKQSSHLKTHTIIHRVEKPFKCDECNKRFSQRHHLNGHFEINHSNEQPYGCSFCSKRFAWSGRLKNHIAICELKC